MITRNQLFQYMRNEMKDFAPIGVIEMIFKSLTNEDLMKIYMLKPLSKGRFYR